MTSSYQSHTDSQLLRSALGSYTGERCLEIGIGYGSNLIDLVHRFSLVAGTDITKTEAFKWLDKKMLNLIVTETASCFREKTFDLVFMNPPYLASELIEDPAVDGGREGFEIPRKFLLDALTVTKDKGTVLILLSSESSCEAFIKYARDLKLEVREIASKHVFFEDLIVYEVKKVPKQSLS